MTADHRGAGPKHGLTRRRMIAVTAASAAALLPGRALAQPRHAVWRGVALGAETQIQLAHPDERRARDMLKTCIDEIRRLEGVFSLYQRGSALNRLNRDGILRDPPLEFVELLSAAHQISEETEGAFDVSVQPLWTVYAEHFARPGADITGPGEKRVRRALDLIDYTAIQSSAGRIALTRPGMALTLNGIAAGVHYRPDRRPAPPQRFPRRACPSGRDLCRREESRWHAVAGRNRRARSVRRYCVTCRAEQPRTRDLGADGSYLFDGRTASSSVRSA